MQTPELLHAAQWRRMQQARRLWQLQATRYPHRDRAAQKWSDRQLHSARLKPVLLPFVLATSNPQSFELD